MGKDVEHQEISFILHSQWECKISAATLEDNLAIYYKIKYTLTIWSINHAPLYLTKWVKNLVSTQKTGMWMFIVTLLIIAKTFKQPGLSFSQWMDKYIIVHPDMEYYSVQKIKVIKP